MFLGEEEYTNILQTSIYIIDQGIIFGNMKPPARCKGHRNIVSGVPNKTTRNLTILCVTNLIKREKRPCMNCNICYNKNIYTHFDKRGETAMRKLLRFDEEHMTKLSGVISSKLDKYAKLKVLIAGRVRRQNSS